MKKLFKILSTGLLALAILANCMPPDLSADTPVDRHLGDPSAQSIISISNKSALPIKIEINGTRFYVRPEVSNSSNWRSPAYPLAQGGKNTVRLTVGTGDGSVSMNITRGNETVQCEIVVSADETGSCSFESLSAYEWRALSTGLSEALAAFCVEGNEEKAFIGSFTKEQQLNLNQAFGFHRQTDCSDNTLMLTPSSVTHVAKFRTLRSPRPEYDIVFSADAGVSLAVRSSPDGFEPFGSTSNGTPIYGIIIASISGEMRGVPITDINKITSILAKSG